MFRVTQASVIARCRASNSRPLCLPGLGGEPLLPPWTPLSRFVSPALAVFWNGPPCPPLLHPAALPPPLGSAGHCLPDCNFSPTAHLSPTPAPPCLTFKCSLGSFPHPRALTRSLLGSLPPLPRLWAVRTLSFPCPPAGNSNSASNTPSLLHKAPPPSIIPGQSLPWPHL